MTTLQGDGFKGRVATAMEGSRGMAKKGRPAEAGRRGVELFGEPMNYFFGAGLADLAGGAAFRFSSMAAWAAASRATGTRNGEQDT